MKTEAEKRLKILLVKMLGLNNNEIYTWYHLQIYKGNVYLKISFKNKFIKNCQDRKAHRYQNQYLWQTRVSSMNFFILQIAWQLFYLEIWRRQVLPMFKIRKIIIVRRLNLRKKNVYIVWIAKNVKLWKLLKENTIHFCFLFNIVVKWTKNSNLMWGMTSEHQVYF